MKDFKQEEKGIKRDIRDKAMAQILGIVFCIIITGGVIYGICKAAENHEENNNITTAYVSDDTVSVAESEPVKEDGQDIFDILLSESTSSSQTQEYEVIGGMEYNDVVYFSSDGLSTGDYLYSNFSIKTYRDINTSVNYLSLTYSGEAQRVVRYNADGSCNTSLPNGKDNVKCIDYETGNNSSKYYRIVDVDTGVTYMVVLSSNEASITPLYNADGSLMINN